jgi:excisionase family DNA binding protein
VVWGSAVTPARRCANGERCACAPALGGPARLSRSNTDTVCYACRERRIDEQLVPPSGRAYTVTEAAGMLGVSRYRVEYLITAGQLRAAKDGRRGLLTIAEGDLRALQGAS